MPRPKRPAGLIRFAFRNTLMTHNAAWRQRTLTVSDGDRHPEKAGRQSKRYGQRVSRTGNHGRVKTKKKVL